MKHSLSLLSLVVGGFFLFALFSGALEKQELPYPSMDGTPNAAYLPQRVVPVPLRDDYDFAGEALPMDNFDVRERLDRELTANAYMHGTTIMILKNAFRYFPIIEPILKEHGIPDDFKYLAVAESSLSNAVSPAGAKGFWQFMKPTAESYQLEITGEVDERYHLEKATHAACDFLQSYYKRFGSWTLTAAAYNQGGTRMASDLREQHMDTYYDMNLNQETMRYVFRIVALKEVMKDPELYGFYIPDQDKFSPIAKATTVTISTSIDNLGAFAKSKGNSYRMLKIYNPWLLDNKLTVRPGKTYELKMP